MAATVINSIYDAIAGWDICYNSDVPVKVRELQSLTTRLGTPEGVVRILSPLDPETSNNSGHIALGTTMKIEWMITDTLYIRPTAHGGALRNSIPQLMNYVTAYLTAIKADRSPTSQSWIEEADWKIGTYSYPNDNSDPYYGVRFILEVHEVIN